MGNQADLSIDLCGRLRLVTATDELAGGLLARPQVRLALAVLLLEPGPVPRETMADVLWPGELPPTWQTSLRGIVGRVRAAFREVGLPDGTVTTAAGCYHLSLPAECAIDVLGAEQDLSAAEQALSQGNDPEALARALAAREVVSQPVLSDCSGPWVERVQARLREWNERAGLVAADAAGRLGDQVRAAELATATLRDNPYLERGHRALMRARHASGDRTGALNAYEDCLSRLKADLGVSPEPETTALYVSLLGHEPELTPIGGSHLPFVGRGAEMASLAAAWTQACAGDGGLVLIRGEPGAGKSRLAHEAARLAHGSGGLILRGRNDPHGGLALQPFVEALSSYEQQRGDQTGADGSLADDLSRLLPGGPVPAATDGTVDPAARWRLFEAVRRWLDQVTAIEPVMLIVEDVQWSSPASLRLLLHVLATENARPLLVLATCRSGPVDDPTRAEALADLQREPVSGQIELGGLDLAAVEELIDVALDLPEDGERSDLAARVARQTAGNALLVSEAVRHLAAGSTNGATGSLPAALSEVVRLRWTNLDRGAREVVGMVALLGGPCPEPVLAHGRAGPELAAALGAAVTAGLLSRQDGKVAFCHDLVREAVVLSLPDETRARLHRALAQGLARREDDGLLTQTAYHWAEAADLNDGSEPEALPWILAASHQSITRFDFEGAAQLLRRASAVVDRTDPLELLTAERFDVYLMLGQTLRHAGDPTHEEALLQALQMARQAGDPVRFARAALELGGWGAPRAALAADERVVSILHEALDGLPEEEAQLRARCRSALALEERWTGQPLDAGGATADAAVATARATGDPETLAASIIARYGVGQRHPAGALDDVEELRRIAPAVPDPGIVCSAAMMSVDAWTQLGEAVRAEAELALLERVASRTHLPYFEWIALTRRAGHAVLRARHDDALQAMDAAMDLGARIGIDAPMMFAGRAGLRLAMALADDDVEQVRPEFDALLQMIEADLSLLAATAVISAEGGDHDSARALLDRAHDLGYQSIPDNEVGMATVMNLARTAARVGDNRAQDLADHLLPRSGHLSWISCVSFGPIDLGLAWTAIAAGEHDEARAHLARAADLSRRVSSPTWTRQVEAELARLR